jgi:hypothetical protein
MNNQLEKARHFYKTGNKDTRDVLEEVFGKESFRRDWRQIRNYKDACEALDIDPKEPLKNIAHNLPEWLVNARAKYIKAVIITAAINEGWQPDYSNSDQQKWFPWYKSSGRGLVFHVVFFVRTGTCVGPRLVFETSEKAQHAGQLQEMIDYINDGLQA